MIADAMTRARRLGLLAILLGTVPSSLIAQDSSTEEVFRRYSPGVTKIEVLDVGATAPPSVGTGFFVHETGLIATNYHVVNDVVYEPDESSVQVVLADGRTVGAKVVAVSAPDDLALLRIDEPAVSTFSIRSAAPEQGVRLFALGHAADLAQSVVEGTFNGPVAHQVSLNSTLRGRSTMA